MTKREVKSFKIFIYYVSILSAILTIGFYNIQLIVVVYLQLSNLFIREDLMTKTMMQQKFYKIEFRYCFKKFMHLVKT